MISNSIMQLSQDCKLMNICGIEMIGCPNTGVIIGLDKEGSQLVHKLKKGIDCNIEQLSESQKLLLNELISNGFFTDQVEPYKVKRSYFHVTSRCNLNCEGCYSFEEHRNKKNDLTLEQIKAILDNLAEAGLCELVISGGEPFLRPDLYNILEYAKKELKIEKIQCITNGTAPIESYLKASEYLDVLTFSLDSSNRHTSVIRPAEVFDAVTKKLSILKEQKVNVAIVFTIHHQNVDKCEDLCLFANNLGVDFRFSVFTVLEFTKKKSPLSLTESDYAKLYSFVSKQMSDAISEHSWSGEIACVLACGAGKNNVSISADGHIYPCHMFVGMEQFCIGSALEGKVLELVNSNKSNPFLSLSVDNFQKCKDCHIRYVCGGGCRFRSYALHNSIYATDKLCETYIHNKEQCIQKLLNP